MLGRIGLLMIGAAAGLALAGCNPAPDQGGNGTGTNTITANNTTNTQTNAGSSGATGGTCGGFVGAQCSSDKDFCKNPEAQCGVADAQGTCTTKPEVCTRERVPVCGCDGKTYGNACEADKAGVSVQAQGECPAGQGESEGNKAGA